MHYDKIFLIGYRATGKSSVGRLLAKRLAYTFYDMDAVIEEREGRTIREMVAAKGWPSFRAKEKALLEELAAGSCLVVATGGGAVLHEELWPRVRNNALVVWLTADRQTICERLQADHKTEGQRPSLTGTDTLAEVSQVLAEREPLYRKASHTSIDTGSLSLEQVVTQIEKIL